jgi:hypothetical protein
MANADRCNKACAMCNSESLETYVHTMLYTYLVYRPEFCKINIRINLSYINDNLIGTKTGLLHSICYPGCIQHKCQRDEGVNYLGFPAPHFSDMKILKE